jgi:type II secretory pathway pseudopilin PulG
MKKHDEGYVLIYVTVVLILFSLIGSMILTSAMKNLNAQQAAITQMQDKYVAQGMIELVAANKLELDGLDENVAGALQISKVENGTQVIAKYGSVQITCVIDSKGKYASYQVASAESEFNEAEEGIE